jgi:hypothetical protein
MGAIMASLTGALSSTSAMSLLQRLSELDTNSFAP